MLYRTQSHEESFISSPHGHKKDMEMSFLNCQNGYRRKAFANDAVTVTNVSKKEMPAFSALTVTFPKRRRLFSESFAMLCRNLMQAATIHSAEGLLANNTSQRKGPFPFQITAIFTPTLRLHQQLPKSGSSCPQCFSLSPCINSHLCYCLCD